jgi:hypothetical protein
MGADAANRSSLMRWRMGAYSLAALSQDTVKAATRE